MIPTIHSEVACEPLWIRAASALQLNSLDYPFSNTTPQKLHPDGHHLTHQTQKNQ